jgi:hypothetical protein
MHCLARNRLCSCAGKRYIRHQRVSQSKSCCRQYHSTTERHCFVLEDGVERFNSFVNNLGVYVTNPRNVITTVTSGGQRVRESDSSASTFWITNPTNSFVGNVAAGAEDSGYWFELFKRGPKADTGAMANVEPSREPLLRFENNAAHSIRVVRAEVAHFAACPNHIFTPVLASYLSRRLRPKRSRRNLRISKLQERIWHVRIATFAMISE